MRHKLELAFDCEHQEELSWVEHWINLAFSDIVLEDKCNLSWFPVQFKHDLNEINESNRSILNRLGGTPSKQYFFDLCVAWVKPQAKLDTLLDEVLLPIRQHLTNHLPRDMNKTILNEVIRHVHIVFTHGDLERQLIQFESVIWVLSSESVETFHVFEDNLNVRWCHLHIVRLGQDDLIHMLVIVPHTEVEI